MKKTDQTIKERIDELAGKLVTKINAEAATAADTRQMGIVYSHKTIGYKVLIYFGSGLRQKNVMIIDGIATTATTARGMYVLPKFSKSTMDIVDEICALQNEYKSGRGLL